MEQLQLSKAFLPHREGEQKPPCIIHGARVLAYAQPFARKWPSLRDLLLTVDYDDFGVTQESEEQVAPSSRLLARLHRLGDNGGGEELRYNVVNDLTNMPSKKVMPGHPLKDHNTKKNVQCE